MSLVAGHFNHSIFEMLMLGHQLVTGTEPTAPDLPVDLKDVVSKMESMNQPDLKLVAELVTRLSKNQGED